MMGLKQGGHTPDHIFEEGGFTLVELMVTVTLISIVAAGLISAFTGQQKAELSQEQVLGMQQRVRASMDVMVMHVRMAGFDPYDSRYDAGIKNAGDGLGESAALVFTYVADDDGIDNAEYSAGSVSGPDGTTDETGEVRTVAFFLTDGDGDGDLDLYMRIGQDDTGTSADEPDGVIAENIDDSAPIFTYLDASGDPVSNLDDIRAVEICLTTKADAVKTDYTVGNATRSLTTLVLCRNLGL